MAGEWKRALDKVAPEKRKALEEALSGVDEFIKELDSGYMRQDDYSAKMDAAKKAQAEWEAEKALMEENFNKAQENYNALFADWTSTAAEKKLAKEQLEAAQKELTEAKSRATIDPEKVLTLDKYKEEQAQAEAGRTAYFAETLSAVYEIEQLTKQRLDPGTFLQESLKSGKTPKIYAEEKFQLSTKREEATKQAKAEEEQRIRDDERTKVVEQYANPATRPMEASKEPFYTPPAGDKQLQPWEITETPKDELQMLNELTKARIN